MQYSYVEDCDPLGSSSWEHMMPRLGAWAKPTWSGGRAQCIDNLWPVIRPGKWNAETTCQMFERNPLPCSSLSRPRCTPPDPDLKSGLHSPATERTRWKGRREEPSHVDQPTNREPPRLCSCRVGGKTKWTLMATCQAELDQNGVRVNFSTLLICQLMLLRWNPT